MASGSKKWSYTRSGTGGTAYIRLNWSSSFNPATSTSTITIIPYLKYSVTNAGTDQRVFGYTAKSTAGIYGNGARLYALSSEDAGGTSPSGDPVLYNSNSSDWGRLYCGTGSIQTFTVKHNASGNASFTIGFYGAVERMYDYLIYGPFGDTASSAISISQSAPYSISYDANGGSGAPSSQSVFATYSYTLSSTRPTRTGYTFLGWSTSSTATTATYQPGASVTISGNLPLYAVWQLNSYTVHFDANGGSGAPEAQTKNYGESLVLSSTSPTRTGFEFAGWATSADAVVAQYQPGGTYAVNADVTLYAVWSVISFTLSSTVSPIGITVNVLRTSSPTGYGSLGLLSDGATLYYGDVIKVSWALSSGYLADTLTVNGVDVSAYSPAEDIVTITDNLTVVMTVKTGGVVYITNQPYQVFIWSGSAWEQYEAYIYNGATWDAY